MTQWSNELSYEVSEDGYDIFLHGELWITQHEPLIPNPDMSYEENALWHCEQLDETVNPDKVLKRYKTDKIAEMKENLNSFLNQASVISECHNGKKTYSVSSEKQQLLAAMIQRKIYSDENNIVFDAYWNEKGGVAEIYTLNELQQLSIEIYQFVQPYVTAEQQREQEIHACRSMEEVDNIDITFE